MNWRLYKNHATVLTEALLQRASIFLSFAGKMKRWQVVLIVIAAILCGIGIALWIVVGVVVSNPLDGSKLLHFLSIGCLLNYLYK